MLDLVKALLALRIAVMVIAVGAALALLAARSLSRGDIGTGTAILTAVIGCVLLLAAAVRSRTRER